MGKASTTKPNPMRYIQRKDKGYHAWQVAIKRTKQYICKSFADSVYGGTAEALAAAIQWRDQKVVELTNEDYAVWKRERMRPDNTSGTIGVSRSIHTDRQKKRITKQASWHAYWKNADGTRRSRAFSVSKYGEEQAKQMAIQARAEGMQDVVRQFQSNATG